MGKLQIWGGLLLASFSLLMAGCGGSGSSSSSTNTQATGSGALKLTVKWPVRSKLIPVDSNSIVATLSDSTGKSLGQQVLARPTTGNSTTVTYTGLAAGGVTLSASAYPTTQGTGVAQATGSAPATIIAGQTGQVTVTMNDTIVSVAITPASPSITPGATTTLTMTAYDAAGDVVLTSPTTTKWQSANTAAVTITNAGVATGVTPGTSLITVTETESGKSGTTTATVQNFDPVNIVTDTSGKYAYSIDNFGFIYQFSVGANGQLTPLSPASVQTGYVPTSFEGFGGGYTTYVSSSNYLYTIEHPTSQAENNYVLQYQIQSNGQLKAMSPLALALPTNMVFDTMFSDPSGKFLYIQLNGSPNNALRTYAIGTSGVLTQSGSDINSTAIINSAQSIPGTSYILTNQNDSFVTVQVQSDGTLKPVATNADFVYDTLTYVAPKGNFAYGLSRSDGLLHGFTINSDGSLTDNGVALAGTSAWSQANIVGTSNGSYMVVRLVGSIGSYSVGANGTLTQISNINRVAQSNIYDPIALTPNNQFVYDPESPDLAQFSLSSSGVLAPLNPDTIK